MANDDRTARLARVAQVSIAKGDWPAAEAALGQLVLCVPRDTALAYNLALVEKRLGRLEAAERRLAAILELEPGHANARFEYAAALMDRGAEPEALDAFEAYLAGRPEDADARFNAGRLALRLGDTVRAIRHLETAIAVRPGDPAVALALAEAQRDAGLLEEADRTFRALFAGLPALRPAVLKAMSQGSRGRLRLDACRLADNAG